MKPIYCILDSFSLVTISDQSLEVELNCYFISQENRVIRDLLGHYFYSQLCCRSLSHFYTINYQIIFYYFANCFFSQRDIPVPHHAYDQKTSNFQLECIQVHFITTCSYPLNGLSFLVFSVLTESHYTLVSPRFARTQGCKFQLFFPPLPVLLEVQGVQCFTTISVTDADKVLLPFGLVSLAGKQKEMLVFNTLQYKWQRKHTGQKGLAGCIVPVTHKIPNPALHKSSWSPPGACEIRLPCHESVLSFFWYLT